MAWMELWVRLKVVDLVAQTALITFTEKLEFENELLGLVRYSYWGMNAKGGGNEELLAEVDRVIRMDSAFTNQNKHLYLLALAAPGVGEGTGPSGDGKSRILMSTGDLTLEKDFPIRGTGGGESASDESKFAFDCLVREQDGRREKGYQGRLNGRLNGVEVVDLKAGEVWRLIVRAASANEASERVERMLITRSRKQGLLLNPHYQKYELLASIQIGRKEGVR